MSFLKLRGTVVCALSIMLCLVSTWSIGQQYNVASIVPPSPNAASLGKFGGIQPGLSSGAVNVNIPITEFKAGKLSMPISLSYTSSGFKVDEIASRVGAGWRLNAGGVITRTLYGALDEYTNPLWTSATAASGTMRQTIDFLNKITGQSQGYYKTEPYTNYDGQPDVFSFNFNGKNGQFIMKPAAPDPDGSRNFEIVLLNHSGLKFETRLGKTPSGFVFKAIDEDGVQYLFNATETTTNNDTGASGFTYGECPGLQTYSSVPSAFYLTKVIHPNNDTVSLSYTSRTFSYATGLSESMYHSDPNNSPASCYGSTVFFPNLTGSICTNVLKTAGQILSEINSTSGGKIKFTYVDRTDYDDQLLSTIEIYQPGQTTALKKFSLTYQYANNRPFLMSVTEKDTVGNPNQKYELAYNSLDQVPALLSFSQDYWGYFNGRSNTTMIPNPTDEVYKYYLPLATANREPDASYSRVGLLSSVKYPTGGKDSIIYEGNTSYRTITVPGTSASVSASGNGTAWPSSTYSSNAVLAYKQVVLVNGNCDDNTVDPDDPDVHLAIINATTNVEVYNKTLSYGETVADRLLLDAGTYKIKITIYGNANVTGYLSYTSGSPTTHLGNANVGGVRVAKVTSYDPVSNVSIIKRYNYSLFTDTSRSSATTNPYQTFSSYDYTYYLCKENSLDCGFWLSKGWLAMHSSSMYNLFISSFNPVTYANVTEVQGEDGAGGSIQHQFTTVPDDPASVQMGQYVSGTPNINNSQSDSREIYTGIFRKTASGLLPVRKTFTHYKDDTRRDSIITGYSAMRNYDYACDKLSSPNDQEIGAYNLSTYLLYRKWIYPDTVRVQDFSGDGVNYSEQVKIEEYGNPYHALVTKEQVSDSEGNMLSTVSAYPTDFAPTTPYNNMVTAHILSPVVERSSYKNSTFLQATHTNYANWGGTIYTPETIQSKVGSGSYETRVHYYNYNSLGNPTCVSQEGGPKTTYLYSYGGQLPVAEIKNADYAAVETVLGATTISDFSKLFPAKSSVDSFLAPLNTGLPTSFISKIVFSPLIGMTSLTDSKGQTTYFEYDNFQRLVNIKDQYDNILKHTDYHYFNQ